MADEQIFNEMKHLYVPGELPECNQNRMNTTPAKQICTYCLTQIFYPIQERRNLINESKIVF